MGVWEGEGGEINRHLISFFLIEIERWEEELDGGHAKFGVWLPS